MTKLESFLKNNSVKIMPSGKTACDKEAKHMARPKLLRRIIMTAAFFTISAAAMANGNNQIAPSNDSIPNNVKDSITLAFDSRLIRAADSLQTTGLSEGESVRQGLTIAWSDAVKPLEGNGKNNDAEYSIIGNRYAEIYNNSFTTTVTTEGSCSENSCSAVNHSTTTYNEGSLDKLKKSVKERNQSKTISYNEALKISNSNSR